MIKKFVMFIVKRVLPGYSLHKNPPKGIKRKRKSKAQPELPLTGEKS